MTNARVGQIAVITLIAEEPAAIRIGGLAVISLIKNGESFVSLNEVIALECWQPCTSYGTEGTIYYVG